MEKIINGATVKVNEEGYLTDFTQWNKNIAEEIAKQEGVNGSSGITDIKEFYSLFPNGPLKKASKIAGIPKPVSCI